MGDCYRAPPSGPSSFVHITWIRSVVLDRPIITAASVKLNGRDILHKIVSVVCVVVLVSHRVLLVEFPIVVLACTTIVAYVRRNRSFMHPIVPPGCVVVVVTHLVITVVAVLPVPAV